MSRPAHGSYDPFMWRIGVKNEKRQAERGRIEP